MSVYFCVSCYNKNTMYKKRKKGIMGWLLPLAGGLLLVKFADQIKPTLKNIPLIKKLYENE